MYTDGSAAGAGAGVATAPRKRRYPVAKIKGGWTPQEDEHLKR